MIYKYEDKYYVKVEQYYVEVELIFENDDVDLRPTYEKLEDDKNIKFEEFNFLRHKKVLLEEHNKKPVANDEKIIKQQNNIGTRKY